MDSAADSPDKALSILLADDDKGDRQLIRRALAKSGLVFECVEALSIKEALEVCQDQYFDCIIVDYRLPGESGLDAISALHALLPFVAIIMSTNQGDEMVATEALKRGALDYIPKATIHPPSIRRIVENAVEEAALRKTVVEQQNELKVFAQVLAHDLKTPVRSVGLYAALLERSVRLSKQEEALEYSSLVIKLARDLHGMIETLYQYTLAEQRVPFEPVPMQDVLTDTLSELNSLILERKANVTRGSLPIIFGNRAQLRQLLQNLIANGIKYCSATFPAIHIEAALQDSKMWLFSVKDNGIGIAETFP